MILNKDAIPFLKGKVFSSGYSLKISDGKTKLHNRIDLITALCRKKKVIHIGFADHINLIENKISKNQWLHKRILDVADRCIGIDIDEEAVNFVAEKTGIGDIYSYDLVSSPPMDLLLSDHWDIMVMGEIIEHVDNPVCFLESLHKKYGNVVSRLVITAPNALRFKNAYAFLNREEYINSDHRFWFTPYTLAKVAILAGWQPEEFEFTDGSGYPFRIVPKLFPVLGDTMVMMLSARTDDL